MHINRVHVLAALGAILLVGCNGDGEGSGPPPPPPAATSSTNAVVLEWNQILTTNAGAGNLYTFRQYAMLHIAMFDAANAVKGQYKPYRLQPPNDGVGSDEAAAAQAAHDVMVSFFPAATASFDTALSARLASLPAATVPSGVDIGKQVAANIVAWRTNDGSAGPDPAYNPPALPGYWQPSPAGQVAAGGRYATTRPFALIGATQFLPAPPPLLSSVEWAQNFQQVHDIGGTISATRTADQTTLARAVAGVNYSPGPIGVWNNVARGIVTARKMSLIDSARLFAQMFVSMHDGIQTTMTSKYVYNFWRPVTAIPNAATDANAATTADPTWTPLIPTPPYPAYASNMMCIANSAARSLAKSLGSDTYTFSSTWTWTGAVGAGTDYTRQYSTFSQLANDVGMSRIYGGIHYEFDVTAGAMAGMNVADYVFANYMTPR
jgi:membrane-associated phospholipid phosphatase